MNEILMRKFRALLDTQFFPGASKALDYFDKLYVVISPTTGRPRIVVDSRGRKIFTIRASDYCIIPTIVLAEILKKLAPYPCLRVVVCNEVAEFIAKGGNVFARHVLQVHDDIRAGDEVLVVDEEDSLLAVGRARLSAMEMMYFTRGVAVTTREGILKCRNSEGSR